MLGQHLPFAISPTSDADRKALQRHFIALLMDLRRNPTRYPQLKNKCLAVTDYMAVTESKLFSVPAVREGGRMRELLVGLPGAQ
jgi:hypothetical protein